MAILTKDQIKQAIDGRPEGVSPEEVIAALAETHTLEAYPVSRHLRTKKEYLRKRQEILAGKAAADAESLGAQADAARGVLETIPQVSGALGGLAGTGVGASSLGAGLGGAAGETLVQGAKYLAGEGFDTKAITRQAAFQAGGAALGAGLAKGAGYAARTAMRLALKSTPEVAETAIRQGITANSRGLDKLLGQLKERGEWVKRLADQATRSGQKFQRADIVKEVARRTLDDVAKTPDPNAALNWVRGKAASVLKSPNGSMWSPNQVVLFKRSAEQAASKFYKLKDQLAPNPINAVSELWEKHFADVSREMLETLPQRARTAWSNGVELSIPDLQRESSDLIRVKEALFPIARRGRQFAERAAAPAIRTAVGGAIGTLAPGNDYQNAAIGALGGAALGSPTSLSLIGRGLTGANPLLASLLPQLFRAGGGAVAQPGGE